MNTNVLRWQIGYGSFGVPQAAAPIAFALIALPITGSAASGAGLVFAMTAAQVLGSVPVSRLGARFHPVAYLRALIAVRTLALAGMTVLAATTAPFAWLMIAALAAGAVNGAAYGFQRTLLNHLVEPGRLPRALGVAATLNELSFALSPVLASVLGAVSPVWAMVAITLLGIGPLVLTPAVPEARAPRADRTAPRVRSRLPREVLLWLLCSAATGAAVAAIEVGAVSFALSFDLDPAWAFVFALALCVGSVLGGVWVSVRNRTPGLWKVVTFLVATSSGLGLALYDGGLVLTLAGAFLVGIFLPMLGTFYSLALDRIVPRDRRAELFAHLRTANALGVMGVSGLLALDGLGTALVSSLGLLVLATLCAAVFAWVTGGGPEQRSDVRILDV
ncbi:MAG TPA: MFS transporter [Brevibacterium sp.]|nr:MFS transporter [Brevibacterium sp.]